MTNHLCFYMYNKIWDTGIPLLFKDSEEKKSTTLDVKLKETERELKQHEKEIADQMEVKQQVV